MTKQSTLPSSDKRATLGHPSQVWTRGLERRLWLIVLTPDVVQGQGVCGRRHALGIDLTQALEVAEYLRELLTELRDVIVAQTNSRQPRDVLYLLFGKGQ